MTPITIFLGGVELRVPIIPFTETPLEKSVDVETLDFTLYTDWTARKKEWRINWGVLTEQQYEALYDIYVSQFQTGVYPTLEIPKLDINTQVRVYLSLRDIRKSGCEMHRVNVRLVEKNAVGVETS